MKNKLNKFYKGYEIVIIKKKIKHTYMRVKDKKIIITTSYLTPNFYIQKLINDNELKLDKMISSVEQKVEKDNKFYLFGKIYELIFDENIKNIKFEEDKIIVANKKELERYLNELINNIFSKQMNYWYNKFEEEIPIPNLKLRKMKTRWGVCNTKNHNVTLNYYLYKYDLDCLDYVIVHELSHFIHGNHSSNFWQLVKKYYPNYKEVRKKLRS